MRYDWITIALENKGILIVKQGKRGFVAKMGWAGEKPVHGEPQSTVPDALNSLNEALLEDAASECQL